MTRSTRTTLSLATALITTLAALPALAQEAVLSIGGSVTEVVFALGEEGRLVARDTTSNYPPAVFDLPDVGYIRALSPEGVLSVSPDLILTEEGAGPPEAVEVLKAANIEFVTVPDGFTAEAVATKIRAVGSALGVEEKAEALAADVLAGIEAAAEKAKAATADAEPKRVLFILSTQGGRILASGANTAAAGIIDLAGGVNVLEDFEGYKPVTAEAVTAAAPDVILMMDRSGDHAAANAELFLMPALITTPAARTRSVVRMDGMLLLGFGPRTAEAVTALSEALYGG